MKNEQMQYQVKKTVRLGLTLVEKKIFDKNIGKINQEDLYQSHSILKDLVKKSEENILKLEKCKVKSDEIFTHENLVKKTENIINQLEIVLNDWGAVICKDSNFLFSILEFTKDYYKQMSLKARFDYINPNKGKFKVTDIDIQNKIKDYWVYVLQKIKQRIYIFNDELKIYNIAINETNNAHKKPNLVEFRKQCIGIIHLFEEVVHPIIYENISIFEISYKLIEKKIINENSYFNIFVENHLEKIYTKVQELKIVLQENGGYNFFGKASFNIYTALQKPHNYLNDLDEALSSFMNNIIELIKKLFNENDEDIKMYFNKEDIINKIYNENINKIERAQMYKPHPIKAEIIQLLPEYIALNYDTKFKKLDTAEKQYDKNFANKIRSILKLIGKPIDIGKEYKLMKDKTNFNLNNYPLKLAFNYAWNILAQSKYSDQISFDKKKCVDFLQSVFNVNVNNIEINESFILYAQLLHLQSLISNIEYCNIEKGNLYNISMCFQKIYNDLIESPTKLFESNIDKKKNNEKNVFFIYLNNIKECIDILIKDNEWIKFNEECNFNKNKSEECKKLKNKILSEQQLNEYKKAKQEIGMYRGYLKTSSVSKYNDLSELFKSNYSENNKIDLGRLQAELRDKLNEENNINKIEYFSSLLQDKNNDYYILLTPINYKNDDNITTFEETIIEEISKVNINTGILNIFNLKTFTSKTLHKIISNLDRYKGEFDKGTKPRYIKPQTKYEYFNSSYFIDWLKENLKNSKMSKCQDWREFQWDFDNCNTLEEIYKEIDFKSYIFNKGRKISVEKISIYIDRYKCLLLPIINQDLINKNKEKEALNQFTIDWYNILKVENKEHRLHPEFTILFRQSTKDYPYPNEKRYSRFQMIAHFEYDIIPPEMPYYNVKKQIQIFNNKKNESQKNETQENHVKKVNKIVENKFKSENGFFIVGIDRGLKRLGILSIISQDGEVLNDNFNIYTRRFDENKRQWLHSIIKQKKEVSFLDLSNLKLETTINGEKVLVDLSTIKIQKNKDNQQKIRLKQLAYLRELQYTMSVEYGKQDKNTNSVLQFYNKYQLDNEENFYSLDISNQAVKDDLDKLLGIKHFVEGHHYENLTDIFNNEPNIIFKHLKEYYDNIDNYESLLNTIELFGVENYKKGVVANMIGVINYIVNDYLKNYNVIIAIEDLTKSFWYMKKGIDLLSNQYFEEEEFKENTNKRMAGLGLYHFFEMQLLKKIFKVQRERNILMIPSFRAESDFEKIVLPDKNNGQNSEVFKFGIVNFVNPSHTSKCCPYCGATNEAKRKDDQITCSNCSYNLKEYIKNINLNLNKNFNFKNESIISKEIRKNNLKFITNADENAAYNIALKALINLKQK